MKIKFHKDINFNFIFENITKIKFHKDINFNFIFENMTKIKFHKDINFNFYPRKCNEDKILQRHKF